jgi:hypothetical protein
MPLIFQFGSNCFAARLNSPQRLNGAALVKSAAQTLDEYEITCDVWSNTNQCAAADLFPAPGTGHFAWGVLYETSEHGLNQLCGVEGPSYEKKWIRVRTRTGEDSEATTFLVRPGKREHGLWTSAEYVSCIVRRLRENEILEEYTQHVLDVAIRTNKKAKDQKAAKEEARLIEELRIR